MSSNNNNRSTIPGGAGSNTGAHGSRHSLPPSFLVVGTAVSAKYRGAFCEATVDHVERGFRLRVQLKSNKSIVFADKNSLVSGSPVVGSEVVVQIPNSSPIQNGLGVVTRVTDTSMYSVVFDDGDRRTLRRTQLVLKGERHFKESESLDSLPLTNPEQFRQPVIDQRRKHRSGEESSTMDANVPEIKKENVSVKNDIKVSNENVSDHNIKPEEPTEDHDKNISLNCKIDGDVHCPAITEISVDEEKAELSQSKAESKSDVVATDIKQLPTGYCRLLGRLVMVDMPLTAKDCIGSPTHGSSTPIVKSPSLLSRRRFTPALVVLPSAMPSIDLGNTSKSIGSDGVNEDDVKTPSYKLLVRSFKDNKFFAVSVAFVRRLKRSDAVEISHSHPTLRSAFERALLWLDRCELPISWGENSIELMLGTKDWRSLKRRCKLTGSDFSDSTILSPPNLKHSRVSSPASSEASHTANNCRENFQKSSGTRSVNKSDKAARKRPRLSDKTQSPRSSCRLKVKRLKTQILRSDTTGDNQSDDASSNEFSKRSTATKHENAKENMKSQKSDDDSSDSTSSDEGTSSNSVESDTSDTRSLSSLVSSSTNKSSSSVSSTISSLSSSSSSITSSCSTGSTSSSSSTNNSTSSSINSSSSTTASCASPDRSSTSSVAGFEARDRWIAQLYRFMDERGTPINKAPSLANKDLDLYKLYKLVQKLGGFHRVTSQLKWGYVYSKMDLPQNVSGGPRNLQAAFKKYLYPWDDITKKLGTNICELPSPRPRYSSSVQNASPIVQVSGSTSAPTTNSSASASTSASTNSTKLQLFSSREKQSQDSGNLEMGVKSSILDSAEITQASSTEESKTTAVTNTTSTTTTSLSKKRASDKNCAVDQQLAPYLKAMDDEYTCQATPLRKSTSSDDKLSKTASVTDGADRPISSASSNSSSKSAFRKRSYDSTMTDIPLINFGRECIGAMGDLSNRIIPVRSRVRVRCGDHVAYEAKVLKHIRPQPSICSRKTDSADGSSTIPTSAAAVWAGVGDIQYRVHYMGWNTRHDEVVPRSRIISVIEWGRGVDEGRPPSCSSLSPIVHEPRKGNTIKIRNESLSKDICTKLSSSTDIKVAEKESADKEAQDESTLEDDNEHEDDDSNQSQTTETASDNITTTAPIIRRRRLMFSSHKPGRQISSRKPSSLSKRNESSSQRLSKLPLLSRFHLPKTHRHVTKTNISEESKQLNTDSIVKKAKTTSRGSKTDRKSVKKLDPVKRSQSNISLGSDISGTSSPTPSSKTQIKPKKMKIENRSDESTSQKSYSISDIIPTVEIKRLITDTLSTDIGRQSVDNHQSTNKLPTKATTSQRKVVNKKSPRKAFTSSESSSKLSPTLKSKLMSVSNAFKAKKFVSKLSKLTKRKAVHNESNISPRKLIKQEERISGRNLFEDCFNNLSLKTGLSRTLPSTTSKDNKMSKLIQLKENDKLSVVTDKLSFSCAPLSLQTTAMTTTTPVAIPSFASSSSSSSGSFATTKNENEDKYSLLREKRSEESSIKQILFKKKETKTTSHPTKKLTTTTTTTPPTTTTTATTTTPTIVTTAGISAAISTTAPATITSISTPAVVTDTTTTATTVYPRISVLDNYDAYRYIGLERKITESDFTSSTGANLKLVISRINEKSKSKTKSKKLSKSTDEKYPVNKSNNQYVHPSPYIEDISDGDSSSSSSASDNDEIESASKSSRSRLRNSARNSTNSSTTSSHKKHEHPIKQSTITISDISSASSNIDSEHEDNNNNNNMTSEYLHNEIIDSSSESVYGTNDALPRLTRSQHRQLLGDTPPGSTLQTAAPTPSNRSASTTHASKSAKHKSSQLKEQSDEIENITEVSTEMEDLPILSQMQQPHVDLSDSEVIGKLDGMPTQKTGNDENDAESVSENCECIDLEKMDISMKEGSVESPTNHSIPNLSPKVPYDDTEDIDVGINEYQNESIVSEPTIIHDKQVEVSREDIEKALGDNDTEDDRSSVETMSTDPMDGMLYDLTMSSVKSRQQLSSNEDEEVEEVPHSVHSSDQPVDITATVDTLPDKETQPINEVVEVKETNETVENKPTIEPVNDEQRDKITEIEQTNVPKSRSRVRRSSSNSNSTDTTGRRGKRRNRSSSHRVMISETSSALNTNSPHYPPISPHPGSGTIVSPPVPSGSKAGVSQANNRPTVSLRRFGGPFLPIPGYNDLPPEMRCYVLQERMRQIVGAWRQAKQCLKDLDHRCSRSRRLKARKYLENLTNIALSSAGLKNCRQVVS